MGLRGDKQRPLLKNARPREWLVQENEKAGEPMKKGKTKSKVGGK